MTGLPGTRRSKKRRPLPLLVKHGSLIIKVGVTFISKTERQLLLGKTAQMATPMIVKRLCDLE